MLVVGSGPNGLEVAGDIAEYFAKYKNRKVGIATKDKVVLRNFPAKA